MKDVAFREQELNRWIKLFSDSKVMKYDDTGHFVQEEKGSKLCPVIEEFMRK